MLTAVAVLAALFVAVRDTVRVNRLLAGQAADRKRSQALEITAWATGESDYPDTPPANIIGNPWHAAAHVLNNSSAPISEVEVEIGHLNPAGKWESFRGIERRHILPPGGRIDAAFTEDHVRAMSNPKYNVLLCRLTFRDNAGVRWRRDESNNLIEIEKK